MKPRKHVNLFVRNSWFGAMCSSVIHEWAKGRYDSVSVCYCEEDEGNENIYWLYNLIRTANASHANPCAFREIIIIGMCPEKEKLNLLATLPDVHITVHEAEYISSNQRVRKTMKKYLGFFTFKWIYGYQRLYEIIHENILDTRALRDFVSIHGADELEHLITAFVHDLKQPNEFLVCDMLDYYYEVFTRRESDDKSPSRSL